MTVEAHFENAQHKLLNHALSCLLRFGERLSISFIPADSQREHVVRPSVGHPITPCTLLIVGHLSSDS